MSTFIEVLGCVALGSIAALIVLAVVGHYLDTQRLVHNREAAAIASMRKKQGRQRLGRRIHRVHRPCAAQLRGLRESDLRAAFSSALNDFSRRFGHWLMEGFCPR